MKNIGDRRLMRLLDYRPKIHFSVKENWSNDPNGLVYKDGTYHMYYQYHPESINWGPMHWGHAVSKDLINWEYKDIALKPDKNGCCFSGSAVIDKENTSKLFDDENGIVAMYTSAKVDSIDGYNLQTQSIAYSKDNGETWEMYKGNPVIDRNLEDFRDPKVLWFDKEKKWVMLIATKDIIEFYESKNLLEWTKTGEYGQELGLTEGVWECPDLLPFEVEEEIIWLLKISIQGGAQNGGSGEIFVIGDFDGKTFTSKDGSYKWIDLGGDIYASQTYYNTGNRFILVGWMSNILYLDIPTSDKWRGLMTLPRTIELVKENSNYVIKQYPVKEIENYRSKEKKISNFKLDNESKEIELYTEAQEIIVKMKNSEDDKLSFQIGNNLGEYVDLMLDIENSEIVFDRQKSGKVDFSEKYPDVKRENYEFKDENEIRIIIDKCSIEIFVNGGEKVITSLIFPNENYSKMSIFGDEGIEIVEIRNYLLEV